MAAITPIKVPPFIDQLGADISSLQEIPNFPFDEFERLGCALVSDFVERVDLSAAVTADNRVTAKDALGTFEIFAAAMNALNRYLIHQKSTD